MARQLRVAFPGAIYHVTCRRIGDGRGDQSRLFTDDKERERFLGRLGEGVEEYNLRLYLFVLMTNHFHLVFETPEGNGSRFMQALLTAYTVYYNLRHRRHGHLFDGRFKAKVVQGDDYLLALTRYVHLNPVRVVGIKDRPIQERIDYLRQYRWSTYPSYVGTRKGYDFVTYGPTLAQMSGKRRQRPAQYRAFVESGLAKTDEEFEAAMNASPRSIGSEGFRAWVDALCEKRAVDHGPTEDVAFRRVTEPMDAGAVLEIVAGEMGVETGEFLRRRRDSMLRAVAARYLMRYAGQTQRDIGKLLKAGSGSAISKQMAKQRTASHDGGLAATLARIERRLEKERLQRPGLALKYYLKG